METAKCIKCGEPVIGDEDSICGLCSGEGVEEWAMIHGAYQDQDGEWII